MKKRFAFCLHLLFFLNASSQAVWSELGGNNISTFNQFISQITNDKCGNLYAAGNFYNINNRKYVAKWNGVNWSELGGVNSSAFNNSIAAVCCDDSCNVYAAGRFQNGQAC